MSLTSQLRVGFDKIFTKAKESVTRQKITYTYDANDDVSEEVAEESIDAVIQIIQLEDVNEFGGLLKVGDGVAFIENDTDVVKGDRIVHNSITYEIDRIILEGVAGNQIFKHAFLKPVTYA